MAEPKNESKESRFAKWVASVPWRGGQWDLLLWLVAIFVGVFFGANWVFFARLIPLIRSSLAAEAFKDPGSIAQLVAGLLTFWAGIALAAMWVWRNTISAKEAETSRIQAKVALDTQISTDLTKAYEQLGSDKMAVRIGAIYTLEKVMRDVQDTDFNLYWSIIETLCSFGRERSEKLRLRKASNKFKNRDDNSPVVVFDSGRDICVVVRVIGRRRFVDEDRKIDLRDFELCRCHVPNESANFHNCDFTGANLTHSNMENKKFKHSVFFMANMRSGNFKNSDFSHADLNGSDLIYSWIGGCDFSDAIISENNVSKSITSRETVFPWGRGKAHWREKDDEDDSED